MPALALTWSDLRRNPLEIVITWRTIVANSRHVRESNVGMIGLESSCRVICAN